MRCLYSEQSRLHRYVKGIVFSSIVRGHEIFLAVMRAAMINVDDKYQQQIVHRLFQNAGNVNLTTNEVIRTIDLDRDKNIFIDSPNCIDVGREIRQSRFS